MIATVHVVINYSAYIINTKKVRVGVQLATITGVQVGKQTLALSVGS